jgi:tRNA pseudouridine55 synthase
MTAAASLPADGGSPGAVPPTDGLFVVNKPPGPTSHDVVAVVRRTAGFRKVGHTGTLDPFAEGVLPLLVGRATRLAQFFAGADKEYDAEVRLGASTDTYDVTGRIAGPQTPGPAVPLPEPAEIERAVAAFRGTFLQEPPPFSAKKVLGTPAYHLARHDRPVRLAPVEVTVHALEIQSLTGDRLRLRVVCSAGFYVRALAHGIGERLGTGAYLHALTRTRCGEFTLQGAVPLASFTDDPAAALAGMVPVDRLLGGLPAAILTADGRRRAARGNLVGPAHLVRPASFGAAAHVRLLDQAGRLVAIARPTAEPGVLHPGVVLE